MSDSVANIVAGGVIVAGVLIATLVLYAFFRTRPRAPIKIGKMQTIKIHCAVCGEPIEDGQFIAHRPGEAPMWHVQHEEPKA